MIQGFDFEIDRIVASIKKGGHKSIILQFPEGLKRQAGEVAEEIGGKLPDIKIKISGEPCYGACDLPSGNGSLVINFGHYPIPSLKQEDEALFIPAKSFMDPEPVLKIALPELEGVVGLISTPQFIHCLGSMIDYLASNNVRAIIGKGGDRLYEEGQVLGCNTSSALSIAGKVDMFLFVGTGNFHPLALALGTRKKVLIADPVVREIRTIHELKDRILRQRHAVITRARDKMNYGILLSTKPGQRREQLAHDIQTKLANAGKKATIVEMGTASPQKLDAFGFEAWVSTACPRLAIDDYLAYSQPILTPPELDILLGQVDWEDYVFDEIE